MSLQDSALPRALGKIVSGLYVVTAGHGEDAIGTLVSFVQQVSLEPLCVAIAVKKGRELGRVLDAHRRFVLNVSHAGDKTLLRKYARQSGTGPEAFTGLRTRQLEGGGVVLLDACAYIECDVSRVLDFGGDHVLYVGTARDGQVLGPPGLEPTVHVRHDGTRY